MKKEITLEDLAGIVQNSLTELKTELKADIRELRTDIARLDVKVDNIEANLNKKIDKIEYNTMDYRVEKLEKRFA